MTQIHKLYTAKQLSQIFQVSIHLIWRLTREGTIPCVRLGKRKIRYVGHDVLNALNEMGNLSRLEEARKTDPEVDPVAVLFEE